MSSFVWHSRHTKELIFAILEEMMTPSREGWGIVVQKYGSAVSAAEAALAAEAAAPAAAGGASAAAVIAETVFLVKSIVCMSGTIGICDISVVSGALICISYHQRNWSSGGFALKDT